MREPAGVESAGVEIAPAAVEMEPAEMGMGMEPAEMGMAMFTAAA